MQAVWVEIPVRDLERAATFYQTVFGLPAGEISDDGVRRTLTLFSPTDSGGIGISLNETADFEPSDTGIYVYFRSGGDSLEKVTDAGGKIVQGRTSMDVGTYASIQDTEGNGLGLYPLP